MKIKKYEFIEVTQDDGRVSLTRRNDGFTMLELIGLMELTQLEIQKAFSEQKQMKLDVVKREIVEESLPEEEIQKIIKNNLQNEDLRTSEEWQKICRIQVLDPDGWDRKNYQYSWFDEKISRKEFEKRMAGSTCVFPEDLNNIWTDQKGL